MRTRRRERRPAGSGLVGPPPRFEHEQEPFDPSGPLVSEDWYARESARFRKAHAAFVEADAAWSDRASTVLGVRLDWLDAFAADNAAEDWPDWSAIPDDVRHLCTTDPEGASRDRP